MVFAIVIWQGIGFASVLTKGYNATLNDAISKKPNPRIDVPVIDLSDGQQINLCDPKPFMAAAFPDSVKVYHKYGWLDSLMHDAAVLNYKSNVIVLVIYMLGKDSIDYNARMA